MQCCALPPLNMFRVLICLAKPLLSNSFLIPFLRSIVASRVFQNKIGARHNFPSHRVRQYKPAKGMICFLLLLLFFCSHCNLSTDLVVKSRDDPFSHTHRHGTLCCCVCVCFFFYSILSCTFATCLFCAAPIPGPWKMNEGR